MLQLLNWLFNEHLGSAGGIFLTIAVTLFAFSSVVGNYYYGQSNIEFLSTNRVILFIFRCLVVLVFVGAVKNRNSMEYGRLYLWA
ncbi:alanine:cation symporter family protein [Staphylococcus aureus]